jgi:hypothetical protein
MDVDLALADVTVADPYNRLVTGLETDNFRISENNVEQERSGSVAPRILQLAVRRTWQTHEPQQGVHGGYTENDACVIPFKSRRKNGGGGGSRNIHGH